MVTEQKERMRKKLSRYWILQSSLYLMQNLVEAQPRSVWSYFVHCCCDVQPGQNSVDQLHSLYDLLSVLVLSAVLKSVLEQMLICSLPFCLLPSVPATNLNHLALLTVPHQAGQQHQLLRLRQHCFGRDLSVSQVSHCYCPALAILPLPDRTTHLMWVFAAVVVAVHLGQEVG